MQSRAQSGRTLSQTTAGATVALFSAPATVHGPRIMVLVSTRPNPSHFPLVQMSNFYLCVSSKHVGALPSRRLQTKGLRPCKTKCIFLKKTKSSQVSNHQI